MKRRFAHEKLNARDVVRNNPVVVFNPRTGHETYEHGKYRDKPLRPAELIMQDPAYFFWALASNIFDGWLAADALDISWKAGHIKPPRPRPSLWEFAMWFDKDNHLTKIKIVKRSELIKVVPGLVRAKHLDLSVVSNEKPWSAPNKLLSRFVHDNLLPRGPLTKYDYSTYFDVEQNFDLGCREFHCPKSPRRSAPRVCPAYDGFDHLR